MADFHATLDRTLSTTLAVGSIENAGSGQRRIKIYDLTFGATGTPADASIHLQGQRATTSGTATAVTPQPLDPADAAATTVAEDNHTVQGTLTANAFVCDFAMNQRTTFRWVAREGKEIVIPATASNGVHFNTPVAPAVAAVLGVDFTE